MAVVGIVGGPVVLALLVGVVTGIVVHKLTDRISIVQITDYAASQMPLVVAELRNDWDKGTFNDREMLQATAKYAAGWAKSRLGKLKLP